MQYLQPADRHQYQMMSSMDDSISQNHPVRIIDMIIDSVISDNKERFEKERETEAGRPRYHASTLLKLYLYGYFNGICSSRKLETETHRNKEVIWLLGGLAPDHWTIANYRKENGEDIKYITKKFREFLRHNEYIKLKTVAIDGTKIKANTNREILTMAIIEKKLERIDIEVKEYVDKIAENDNKDDIRDELGTEDQIKYLNKIVELKKQIEELENQKEVLQKEGVRYSGSTDMDARLMLSRDGFIPAYNVQIAVDKENKMIVDSEVVQEVNDLSMLPKMIESIKEELGVVPEEIITDKGYSNPELIEEAEKTEQGIDIYIPVPDNTKTEIKFTYNEEKDEYECSAGKVLVLISKNKKKNKSRANVYRGIECAECPLRDQCTKSKQGRTVYRYHNQQWRDAYKAKMSTKESKEKLSLRRTLVEHPFGILKYLMGKIPLLLRGLKKVRIEIDLHTTAFNLKRLMNIEAFENITTKIARFSWKMA